MPWPTGEVDGMWRCRTTFNCTQTCPRGLQVRGHAGRLTESLRRRC
ncbi:hypothetical protein GLP40_20780 [Nocardia sp. CT2-14]|uniref:4Fe-4S ferredoxin-type domain-containing protein n=1 Tax=Nocardia aurantiaca TaxID=2675850 RepID=A0A6I3L2V9_9NOCA|nr:hypothetical protein [Nocardia aurantiaca]